LGLIASQQPYRPTVRLGISSSRRSFSLPCCALLESAFLGLPFDEILQSHHSHESSAYCTPFPAHSRFDSPETQRARPSRPRSRHLARPGIPGRSLRAGNVFRAGRRPERKGTRCGCWRRRDYKPGCELAPQIQPATRRGHCPRDRPGGHCLLAATGARDSARLESNPSSFRRLSTND